MRILSRCRWLAQPWLTQARSFARAPRLEDISDVLPTVALIGRPNVGKSALYNRLVGRREALVYNTPRGHVTRDYRESLGSLGDLQFRVVDTSGLEPSRPQHSLQGRAAQLTAAAVGRADVTLLLIDATAGLVPADEELARWLQRVLPRPQLQRLVLVANKAETRTAQANMAQTVADCQALHLGWPLVAVSATSGEGLTDLYTRLQPYIDAAAAQRQDARQQQQQQQQPAIPDSKHSQVLGEQGEGDLDPAVSPGAGVVTAVPSVQLKHSAGSSYDATSTSTIHNSSSSSSSSSSRRGKGDHHQDLHSERSTTLQHASASAAAAGRRPAQQGLQQQQQQQQQQQDQQEQDEGGEAEEAGAAGPVRVAIMGLPNAGKSTLMNTWLGWERSLTGPEAGLTRDPTAAWLHHGGLQVQLVDTAGWLRRAALSGTRGLPQQDATAASDTPGSAYGWVESPGSSTTATSSSRSSGGAPRSLLAAGQSSEDEDLGELLGEQQQQQQQAQGRQGPGEQDAGGLVDPDVRTALLSAAQEQARRAMKAAHVVVLLLDAPKLQKHNLAITKVELQLASLAVGEGKALLVALNKADAVKGGPPAAAKLLAAVQQVLGERFLEVGRLPVLACSALEGQGVGEVLEAVVDAYRRWNARHPTRQLMRLIDQQRLRMLGRGGASGVLQRVKWLAQVGARPPAFVVSLRGSERRPLDDASQRFLSNLLRSALGLHGLPVRLHLRYARTPTSGTGQERTTHRSRRHSNR